MSLSVVADGVPVPMIGWQKDGQLINEDDDHYHIETSPGKSTLHIDSVEPGDSGWYQCTAVSVQGSAVSKTRIIVQKGNKSISSFIF